MSQQLFQDVFINGATERGWLYCENGKIAALGTGNPPNGLDKNVQKISLGDQFLFPGFIDTHLHLHMMGQYEQRLNLKDCRSKNELLQSLKQYSSAHKDISCIRGFGWDESNWSDQTLPTPTELDAICSQIPVLLCRTDEHAGIANSSLLQKANLQGKNLLQESTLEAAIEHLPKENARDLERALELAQNICLQNGITAIHESAATMHIVESYLSASKKNTLKLYVSMALYGEEAIDFGLKYGPQTWGRLRSYGIKFFLDGALGSRSALLFSPYADDPTTAGIQNISDNDLYQKVFAAVERKFQPLVHAIGPKANQIVINIYEKILQEKKTKLPLRIEHAEVILPEDILRAKKLGQIVFAVQPIHIRSDAKWLTSRLGEKMAKNAGCWNSIFQAGLPLCGGSDAPIDDISPLRGIHAATYRPEHMPEEVLSREAALKSYTELAAFCSGQENVMGNIAVAQLANFVVLDHDIKNCSADELLKTKILHTIVEGKVEYSALPN